MTNISTPPEKYWALLSAMAARVSVVMKRLTSGHPTTCTTWKCHSQESFHFSPRFIIMFRQLLVEAVARQRIIVVFLPKFVEPSKYRHDTAGTGTG